MMQTHNSFNERFSKKLVRKITVTLRKGFKLVCAEDLYRPKNYMPYNYIIN